MFRSILSFRHQLQSSLTLEDSTSSSFSRIVPHQKVRTRFETDTDDISTDEPDVVSGEFGSGSEKGNQDNNRYG